jgi:ectoine hydroxylase-related dioxygenase (phytanoyl-CoA dioxygenase family)
MLGPHLQRPGAQGVQGSRDWFEFATEPEILDMVAQVAGNDLVLWGTTIFGKPAGCGKATPWHQDADYYPIEPLETCSVWMALDDSTPDNGCMRYLPGSHKNRRVFPHHWEEDGDLSINQAIDAEFVDESQARDIVLEAGQISIHDVYLAHASRPNTSDKRRAGFVLRIMPATSYYNHGRGREDGTQHEHQDYGNRALFLIRGEDKSGGRNDFTTGH